MLPQGMGLDRDVAARELLTRVRRRLPDIDTLLAAFVAAEDEGVYRYYHQSFKVYSLQGAVKSARRLFDELAPRGTHLNAWFRAICDDACEHKFDLASSNTSWRAETRPILEGFWHCFFFVRQLARYGRELDEPPQSLPSGWAAVLYLYGIR
jgi:hypothetical protein